MRVFPLLSTSIATWFMARYSFKKEYFRDFWYLFCSWQSHLSWVFFTNCRSDQTNTQHFLDLSGQPVNLQKSTVFLSPRITLAQQSLILSSLGIPYIAPILGIYLGPPHNISKKKKAIFAYLSDKISKKLHGWSELFYLKSVEKLWSNPFYKSFPYLPCLVSFCHGLWSSISILSLPDFSGILPRIDPYIGLVGTSCAN